MRYFFIVDDYEQNPGATVRICREVRESNCKPTDGECRNKARRCYWVREDRLSSDVAAFYSHLAEVYSD